MSKKEKVAFISDSFMDKNGQKHSFIIAAVSIPLNELCFTVFPEVEEQQDLEGIILRKCLSLGYAFCNASDEFKPEIGKMIAEGRAKKKPSKVLFTSDSGMVNTESVNAILKQEADFVKANPQLFIKGFKD